MIDHEVTEFSALFSALFVKELFSGTDRFHKKVQYCLGTLTFRQGTIRSYVARIADGNGSNDDLLEIDRILKATQKETDEAYRWLTDNYDGVCKSHSASYAQKIDLVVSKKMGPEAIRWQLQVLVDQRNLSPENAKRVLREMDEFNQALGTVT